ncbi:hypothetical protein M8J76_004776 [Diaphorina citri]|nr:hypothetical protein M8J76_004776 [Diaphorina citri]
MAGVVYKGRSQEIACYKQSSTKMASYNFALLFLVGVCCFQTIQSMSPPRKTKNQAARDTAAQEVENVFLNLVDSLHEVLGDKTAREFLDKTLDETMIMIQNSGHLQTINSTIGTIVDIFNNQGMMMFFSQSMQLLDHIYTDANLHKLVRNAIEMTLDLLADPNTVILSHNPMVTVRELLNDDRTKQHIGMAVYYLLQVGQKKTIMEGVGNGLKMLNKLVAQPALRNQMYQALTLLQY